MTAKTMTKTLPINAKNAKDAERIARDLFAKTANLRLDAIALKGEEPLRDASDTAAVQPGATATYLFTVTTSRIAPKETPMTAKTATAKTAKTVRANDASPILAAAVEAAITKVCGAHTRTPSAYCGKDLPLADFNKGSDKDGLDRLCKTCSAAWWAASKARSAAKKAAAPATATAKTAKAKTPTATTPKATTPKAKATSTRRDPGARPAIADQADAQRAAADAARLARVKAAVAAAALAEQAAR